MDIITLKSILMKLDSTIVDVHTLLDDETDIVDNDGSTTADRFQGEYGDLQNISEMLVQIQSWFINKLKKVINAEDDDFLDDLGDYSNIGIEPYPDPIEDMMDSIID